MKKITAILFLGFMIAVYSSSAFAVEFDEFGSINIHAYVSQGYLKSNENNLFANTKNGSYALKDAGISFSSDISSRLRMGIQMMVYEMGEFGSDKFTINWANGDYNVDEWFGIKVGKMKLHHGLYNTGRDADFLRTSILLPQSVYNEAWRSTISGISGFETYGTVDVGMMGSFIYNAQVGKVDLDLDSGVATTTKEELLEQGIVYEPDDVDHDKTFVGRLLWETPVPGLDLNVTMYNVAFEMSGSASTITGTPLNVGSYETDATAITGSVEYSIGDLLLVTEYSLSKYEFSLPPLFSESELETEGYYGSAAYRFTDWLEVGSYYSVYYANKDDKDGKSFTIDHSAWLKDACLSFRFDIMDNWVLKLEGHMMNGTAVMMNGNNPDNEKKEDWALFGTKMTFSF